MDKLAKEGAVEKGQVVYDKMQIEVIVKEKITMDFIYGNNSGWIRERGQYRKVFFPSVRKRLLQKFQ